MDGIAQSQNWKECVCYSLELKCLPQGSGAEGLVSIAAWFRSVAWGGEGIIRAVSVG